MALVNLLLPGEYKRRTRIMGNKTYNGYSKKGALTSDKTWMLERITSDEVSVTDATYTFEYARNDSWDNHETANYE